MNMLDPENLGSFGHGQSHGGCEVAGATADIKSIPEAPKFVDEEFESQACIWGAEMVAPKPMDCGES
jgi:uncharacterized protein YbjT (DUF2867 family)